MARMRRLGHILHHKYRGMSQHRILLILKNEGAMKQRELMERMHIQAGSLSEIIAKVESAGYIERARSEEDKRNFDLILTDAGRERAELFEREREQMAQELFSVLDEEEKNKLYGILGVLLDAWLEEYDGCMCKEEGKNNA